MNVQHFNLILRHDIIQLMTSNDDSVFSSFRSSTELEILLNHDPTGPVFQHGERMHLNRLKLAIKYRQKKVKLFLKSFFT
jgi:hypothetical protein